MPIEPYILLALVAALCSAGGTVLCKLIVEDHIEYDETFFLATALVTSVIGGSVVLVRDVAFVFDGYTYVLLVGSGLTSFVPLYLFYRAIRREDASAIGPMYPFQQVVAVGLAFFLLGEVLTMQKYFGIGLILGGVLLVAVVREEGSSIPRLSPAFALVALALILWAITGIIQKHLLTIGIEYWTVFFWNRIVAIPLAGLCLLYSPARTEFKTLISNPIENRYTYIASAEGLATVGTLALLSAYQLGGPVSIVGPVSSTSSLLTVALVAGLAHTGLSIDSDTGTNDFAKKSLAAVLAIAGIVMIS